MLKTYKILSVLLDYPDESTVSCLPSVLEAVKTENLLCFSSQERLRLFIDAAFTLSLDEWQMLYVQQFDCSKTINLYLFDHLYGDSRERGQAMVDMKQMYARSGLAMSADELPDFLPLFLEYLSTISSAEEASKLLSDITPILQKIGEKLDKEGSFYRHLFVLLDRLSEAKCPEMCI